MAPRSAPFGAALVAAGLSFAPAFASAQTAPPPPPPGSAAAPRPPVRTAADPSPVVGGAPGPQGAPACFPACREGFFCDRGRCISQCNPPCPGSQICVGGTRCAYPNEEPPPYEPPPPPPPAPWPLRTHSAIGFHLGFGGTVDAGNAETDLVSTLGFNIRADVPVVRYFVIGPILQFESWSPDAPGDPSRNFAIDIDLFLRGRVPIELESPLGVEFWGGIPIGLTLSILRDEGYDALDGLGFGWNVGFLVGGAVHFTRKFGLFAEVGWLQHRMNHDYVETGGDVDFRYAQGVFNIGFVLGE
jgi:hypothetical protein